MHITTPPHSPISTTPPPTPVLLLPLVKGRPGGVRHKARHENQKSELTPMNGISALQKNFFEKTRNFSVRH